MPSIIEISDLTDPRLDLFARLTEAQLRNRLEPEKGIFIAESPKVIQLALDAGHAPVAFLMERKHVQGGGGTENGAHIGGVHNAFQHRDPAGPLADVLHGGQLRPPYGA